MSIRWRFWESPARPDQGQEDKAEAKLVHIRKSVNDKFVFNLVCGGQSSKKYACTNFQARIRMNEPEI